MFTPPFLSNLVGAARDFATDLKRAYMPSEEWHEQRAPGCYYSKRPKLEDSSPPPSDKNARYLSKRLSLERQTEELTTVAPSETPTKVITMSEEKEDTALYEIEGIEAYHPKQGYLIKWKGYLLPTWNKYKDMPTRNSWVKKRMLELRRSFKRSRAVSLDC